MLQVQPIWSADLTTEIVMVSTKDKQGNPCMIPIKKCRVEIKRGHETIVFKVAKGKNGLPVFTDSREAATGSAPLTTRGPLPGEQYTKPGQTRKLTPTGWAEQVERLIGAAGINVIFVQLITRAGFKPLSRA